MCYPQLLYRSAEDAFPFAPSTQNQAVIATPEAVEDMFRNATVYVSLSDYMAFLLLLTETICLLYFLYSFLEPGFKGRRWMTLVIGLF